MLNFIAPATPVLRSAPPRGADWLHEAKFDGWRIQLHKDGSVARLYTKGGYDCTTRFGGLSSALAAVPARSCIIDGEVTAFDPLGLLDFDALHSGTADDDDIAVWAFDLLFHNGRDVRELPLVERKDLLMVLIMGAGDSRLRLSDGFDDGGELLAAAERMGLEGVVSKRRDAPYRSGSQCGWIKTKTRAWREANKDRWRLFERH
jgi:bifunctional non-homologous end joining protein LigD